MGEMFEGSLKTMRRNPEATIGMAVLVLAAMLVPSLLISSFLPQLASLAREDAIVLANLIPTLLTGIATLALSGFVIYVVSEAALGDRVSIGQTWRAVRGRLLALVGVTLLTGLLLVTVLVAVVLLGVLIGVALFPIGPVLMVLYFLALVPLYLWFYARLALAPAAVVLERAGPATGMKRSWALTRGRQAWRVLGIILLAGIVTAIFSFAVSSVFLFLLLAAVDLGTGSSDLQFYGEIVLNHLVSLIVNAIATPFTAGVTALLYLDQRIRREGLEVGLAKAAQERAAARRS
jgi:MFS family permease